MAVGIDGEEYAVLPTDNQWNTARQLLTYNLANSPSPFISICGDGSIHLQWVNGLKDRGVIEISQECITWMIVPSSLTVAVTDEEYILETVSIDNCAEYVKKFLNV